MPNPVNTKMRMIEGLFNSLPGEKRIYQWVVTQISIKTMCSVDSSILTDRNGKKGKHKTKSKS